MLSNILSVQKCVGSSIKSIRKNLFFAFLIIYSHLGITTYLLPSIKLNFRHSSVQGYTGLLNFIEYAGGFIPVFLYNNQVREHFPTAIITPAAQTKGFTYNDVLSILKIIFFQHL